MCKNRTTINQYVHTAENVQFLHGYGVSDRGEANAEQHPTLRPTRNAAQRYDCLNGIIG